MAIHQTKKQTDLEKRLKLLRTQVYGKANQSSAISFQPSDKTGNTENIVFLRQDLLRISILATLALGAQIILKLYFF